MVAAEDTRFEAALERLSPTERALLELSLRKEVPDQELAGLLRVEPSDIAARRRTVLGTLADELHASTPEIAGALLTMAWSAEEQEPEPPATPARRRRRPRLTLSLPEVPWARGAVKAAALAGVVGLAAATASAQLGQVGPASDEPVLGQESASEQPLVDARTRRPERVRLPPATDDLGAGPSPAPRQPSAEGPSSHSEPAPARPDRPTAAERRAAADRRAASQRRRRLAAARARRRDERPRATTAGAGTAMRRLPGSASGEGRARIVRAGSAARLDLTLRGLSPGPYTVWLYDSVTSAVALGDLGGPGGRLKLRLPERFSRFAYVDVSREPRDGNANHSGASVLRAPVGRLDGPGAG